MKNSAFANFTMRQFFQHIHATQKASLTLAQAANFAASHLLEHNNGGLIAALKYAWRNNASSTKKLENFFKLNAIEFEKCQFNTGIKDAEKRDIIAPFKPKNVQQAPYFISFEQAEDTAKAEAKAAKAAKKEAELLANASAEAELLANASAEAELLANASAEAELLANASAEADKKGVKTPMMKAREAMLTIEKVSSLMTMKEKKALAADLLRLIGALGASKDADSLALTSTLEGEKIAINH